MENFEGTCCISGVAESETLVASHIIPWARRIDCRLDPANGLLLYCPFDRLFDKGFISLSDDLQILVTDIMSTCSIPLRAILEPLRDVQIRSQFDGGLIQSTLPFTVNMP